MVVKMSAPVPPYSSGMARLRRPNWAHFCQFSSDNSPCLSRSINPLFNSFWANSITAFLKSSCSFVQEKSMFSLLLKCYLISEPAPCKASCLLYVRWTRNNVSKITLELAALKKCLFNVDQHPQVSLCMFVFFINEVACDVS